MAINPSQPCKLGLLGGMGFDSAYDGALMRHFQPGKFY